MNGETKLQSYKKILMLFSCPQTYSSDRRADWIVGQAAFEVKVNAFQALQKTDDLEKIVGSRIAGRSQRSHQTESERFWAVEVEFHNEARCPPHPSSVTRQHNIFGTLIVAETKEDRVPQFSVLSPFCVGNLSNESR
jgi:hypothetical protein